MLIAQAASSGFPAEPAQWTVYAVSIVLAALLTWVLNSRHTASGIRKLRAEVITLAGTNLEREQSSRKEYAIACNACKNSVTLLTSSIVEKKTEKEILAARELLCDVFTRDVITAYAVYVEWQCMALYDEKDKIAEFIRTEVVLELRRFCDWRRAINLAIEVYGLPNAPLIIQKRSLRPFYNIAKFADRSTAKEIEDTLAPELAELQK